MQNLNHRNRLVVFRVTQEEYDTLREACLECGARTLSDFARARMLNEDRGDYFSGRMQRRFLHIEQQLAGLSQAVQRFSDILEHGTAVVPAAAPKPAQSQEPA